MHSPCSCTPCSWWFDMSPSSAASGSWTTLDPQFPTQYSDKAAASRECWAGHPEWCRQAKYFFASGSLQVETDTSEAPKIAYTWANHASCITLQSALWSRPFACDCLRHNVHPKLPQTQVYHQHCKMQARSGASPVACLDVCPPHLIGGNTSTRESTGLTELCWTGMAACVMGRSTACACVRT